MEQIIKPARHSAMDFAKYIIDFCTNTGNAISDLKLQKVLYYLQLGFIANLHECAFYDDMEAWPYGPVVRSVYNAYSSYGSTKICLLYEEADVFSDTEKNIIHSILFNCIEKNAWDLVDMSHVKDGPWDRVYQNGKGYKNVIPLEYIKEYALA